MTHRTALPAVATVLGLLVGGMAEGFTGGDGAYEGDFWVHDTMVVPDSTYTARFRVLGSQITAGGKYDVPVTLRVRVGTKTYDPFGSLNSPLGGNVNDHSFPKDFILPEPVSGGTSFALEAKSWVRYSGKDGDRDSEYYQYMTVSSSEQSKNMIVLRNGDPVPDIEPFQDQATISSVVRSHIDSRTGLIRLFEDEVLLLFELGSKDPASPAADFQDLVLLVQLAEDESYFKDVRVPPLLIYD